MGLYLYHTESLQFQEAEWMLYNEICKEESISTINCLLDYSVYQVYVWNMWYHLCICRHLHFLKRFSPVKSPEATWFRLIQSKSQCICKYVRKLTVNARFAQDTMVVHGEAASSLGNSISLGGYQENAGLFHTLIVAWQVLSWMVKLVELRSVDHLNRRHENSNSMVVTSRLWKWVEDWKIICRLQERGDVFGAEILGCPRPYTVTILYFRPIWLL